MEGRPISVLRSDRPVAYAGGLWRSRAVVSTGLLEPIGESERTAVCEHEAAHVRLGHPRVLLAGAIVASAYGALPPVRRAWEGLQRELEAAADDHAVRQVGRPPVLSAIARVALSSQLSGLSGARTVGAIGAVPAGHLRYRISRLQRDRPVRALPTFVSALVMAVVAAAIAWTGCLLGTGQASSTGVAACVAAVAAIGLRPTWSWGRRPGRWRT